jgi:hypothetical protein
VTGSTGRVALASNCNAVAGKATGIGPVKKAGADIQSCVMRKTLDGLCLMIGGGEKKTRRDPVGTGSAIVKQVFGGLK